MNDPNEGFIESPSRSQLKGSLFMNSQKLGSVKKRGLNALQRSGGIANNKLPPLSAESSLLSNKKRKIATQKLLFSTSKTQQQDDADLSRTPSNKYDGTPLSNTYDDLDYDDMLPATRNNNSFVVGQKESDVKTQGDIWSGEGTAYIGLMYTLRQYPNTEEFVYLKRVDTNLSTYNPYALDVVPFSHVDPEDFYTMSVRGVTHYVNGATADFNTLYQWEREFQLFNALMSLNVFKEFRLWKRFKVWNKAVRTSKIQRAKEVLKKNLFHLNPLFQHSLQQVQSLCCGFSKVRLHSITEGKLYTLSDFVAAQKEQRNKVEGELKTFHENTLDTVNSVCHRALSLLEDRLNDFYGIDAAGQLPIFGSTSRPGMHEKNDSNFSYTIAAARRSEQRKLLCFVKLADYMVCDTLHEVLVASVSDILQYTLPADDAESVSGDITPMTQALQSDLLARPTDTSLDFLESKLKNSPSQGNKSKGALFVVEVLSPPDANTLIFNPSSEEFQTKLDDIVSGFLNTLGTISCLVCNEPLMKTLEEHNTEQEGSTRLAELVDDESYQILVAEMKESLGVAFENAHEYRTHFSPYLSMIQSNNSLDIPGIKSRYDEGEFILDQFRKLIEEFKKQKEQIEGLQEFADVGIIQVNSEKLKNSFLPSPVQCLSQLDKLLPDMASGLYKSFITEVHDASMKLTTHLNSVEDFVEQIKFLDIIKERSESLDASNIEIQNMYELIEEYNIPIPELEYASYQTMNPDYSSLKNLMEMAETQKEENITKFNAELDNCVEEINKSVVEIKNSAQQEMIFDPDSNRNEVLIFLNNLEDKVNQQQAAAERVVKFQKLFQVIDSSFEDLEDVADEIILKKNMWKGEAEWTALSQEWHVSSFDKLDPKAMEQHVSTYYKMVVRIERGLPSNKVLPRFKDAVDELKLCLPILHALHNKALKDRHWVKIHDILGQDIQDGVITLGNLIGLNVMDHKDEIALISTEATQELTLEELMGKVISQWADIEFTVLSYKESKDVFILGSIEDVQMALEDSCVTMSTILASRYVSGIRNEVEKLERNLNLFSDTLDEWLTCQKNWMYLESIFSAPDIQRQLPNEAKAFFNVDRQWKDNMRRTKDRGNALQAGTTPGLLDMFQKSNETLDKIQKNLEDYLETKRMTFPRFYFLSNDELLEILAQTKNVQAVQPHMGKCFDGIRKLDFGPDPKSIDIFGMISAEEECIALGKNLKARGNVENWLCSVETHMVSSLRKLAKQGYLEYAEMNREEWILKQPAQLAIVVSQMYWCQGVADKLNEVNPKAGLQFFEGICKDQLSGLTRLVRGDLNKLQRKILVALATIDVHSRDIVTSLIDDGCTSTNDFKWQMQLRYYWDQESDDAEIQQVNFKFNYAFEYLGAQSRLVVTPMTDRCYLTLTGALQLKLGGSPAGPAGTGKTESTKDLGKALGVNCVVFNCGENLDYRFMGKFFSGLTQSGAWACFDEFNRINIEVLSVIAQQLMTIQNALKANLTKFNFEGRDIRLIHTCGVFITMNPGYAGRTELPDNLKALFRPMAMMIPDYGLVAEVMLFSEGFDSSKVLSRKMVKLYKLASEQLSQQDWYDFGMRALKSLLVMAGALKRSSPELTEDLVLIRAMRDANIPKFLQGDCDLFYAIIGDLFPGISVPTTDYGELEVAITETIVSNGHQPLPTFVTKVIQLYETLNVRFGVMCVGPTGSGKTVLSSSLAMALTKLRKDNPASKIEQYQTVHRYTLNPKAIGLGELYGEYNLLTNEWRDGLGSTLIRGGVSDTTVDKKWIVFDGPVDALWIESMNTVLDDNCTLCLPNGERIKLNPNTMRMLFEVQDLAVASPATVSRCGMVYVPEEELGWEPYVKTWLNRDVMHDGSPAIKGEGALPSEDVTAWLDEETKEFLFATFTKYTTSALTWCKKNGKQLIPCVEINMVTTVTKLFQSLFSRMEPDAIEKLKEHEDYITQIGKIFVFSLMWGIGGSLNVASCSAWSAWCRDNLSDLLMFPAQGQVLDYSLDVNTGEVSHWIESVSKFEYSDDTPYFQMIVPTMDTVRYSFLLKTLIDIDHSVLMTGGTGVGKSVITSSALEQMRGSDKVLPFTLNFSAQTTSTDTQNFIESKLEKKRKTRFGAPYGHKIVIFVDDVNMPVKEFYGAQPPIELLRQFCDHRGFYDRKKLFWKDIENTVLVAACAPPGGGRQDVSARFFRHFSQLFIPPASESNTTTIFSSIFGGFLAGFAPEFLSLLDPIVSSSIALYNHISTELLPTPSKSHYTFNLRDISKVFQGILMVKPSSCVSKEQMLRLWVHEECRVFHDRFINNTDKEIFKKLLIDITNSKFTDVSASYDDLFVNRNIMFADFLKMGMDAADRLYEEIDDEARLQKVLNNYLDEYNLSSTTPMHLVFFTDAVMHICRISRILRQPRGNAMLVGVGGSGKQSLTRFSAFMGGFQCFEIELVRNYGSTEFRDDLKNLYKIAGEEGTPVVFCFSDTQIVEESFLEDINNMLNSGEVPGLFAQDELDGICSTMRPIVENMPGVDLTPTKEVCYSTYISRVRDNLHLVLCMSPVGDAFRARCRQFPSLINCTTLDWYTSWPEEALLSVSRKFLVGVVDLGSKEVAESVAKMCVMIHTSVADMSEKFYEELRRRFYTTPKSYLDLISLYTKLLDEKKEEFTEQRDRLLNGLRKLAETNSIIDTMQAELETLKPIIVEKSAATAKLLEKVAEDQLKAEKIQKNVEKESKDVAIVAEATKELADDAKQDLEEALPHLEAAVKALNSLNKQDITEIKSFQKPPPLVQMTMEAVCVLLGEKADWENARKVLSDTNFIKTLISYDKDNIPERQIKLLKKYINDEQFNAERVAQQSKAAKSLCMWCRAMDVYHRIAKVVEPKRQKLREAEESLASANAELAHKQAELQSVQDEVAELKASLAQAKSEQKNLQDQAAQTSQRLAMADKLTSALADEQVRWQETADDLGARMELLVGDVFLASAMIAYYGAFTGAYREKLVKYWIEQCNELEIPCSANCSLKRTLANPVELREWGIWGLPSDEVSTDNGILVTRGRRWPLLIDPQSQANTWIKTMEAKNALRVIKLSDGNFLRTLENSIRIGNPVLIEDVDETLDPALEPILLRQTFEQGGRTLIRLGDTDVDYDPNFKFYLTTKLPNPHYLPEVCIKVTLINFTVTNVGLTDQLLGDVVRQERPDLEEQKDRLVVSISNDKKQLKDLENKILKLLKDSEGNILDDEVLINTLNNSKLTSGMIKNRVLEAEETEKAITTAREEYRPAAKRGSILYFIIADLALIGPMYQYSLSYFTKLFNHCIKVSDKTETVQERISILNTFVTYFIFNNVSRGLFEEHKLLFSFLVCSSIMRGDNLIDANEWDFFLRGAPNLFQVTADNPDPSWISPGIWKKVVYLNAHIPQFKGLVASMCNVTADWKKWFDSETPEDYHLPGTWSGSIKQQEIGLTCEDNGDLKQFQKIILLNVFRPEKGVFGISDFVGDKLGKHFTEPAPWSLDEIYGDTSEHIPIIFILSTGADPSAMLQRFSEKKGWKSGDRLHMISLGQGQGPIAEQLIHQATKTGDWVCLMNCHLASSWMLKLESLVDDISKDSGVHPDFRLWLSSMPSEVFPVLVLQNGIKLTNEPPKGVKTNITRTYNDFSEEQFESIASTCGSNEDNAMLKVKWKKLLFSLSFFHAVLQERRKFGSIGFNIRYEFNTSDLDCSTMNLKSFLEVNSEVPWEALQYIVGMINYGGRVTDDQDRRCLLSIMRNYITADVLKDDYSFTKPGTKKVYYPPSEGSLDSYKNYIASLPANEGPEVFGMHRNANIKFQMQETKKLMETTLSIQPRIASTGTGTSPDETVAALCKALSDEMDAELSFEEALEGLFDRQENGQLNSLSVVLSQEMERFNRLLSTVSKSLSDLQMAIKGEVVMSGDLEKMYTSMLNNQVPEVWANVAYPSLKPLASWISDLHKRVTFMRDWLQNGTPSCFWLPGFFFPQGFMTGVLQMHARTYQIPIDSLNFDFIVKDVENVEDLNEDDLPSDGILVNGLFLDAARWNAVDKCLDESETGVMFSKLPIIHFCPKQDFEAPDTHYLCPLYKTSLRAGVLSTTGQSTNFVLYLSLPSGNFCSDSYILQGTAALCQPD